MIKINLKKLDLKYKELCTVGENGIPKSAVYAGYSIDNDNHVFLTRNLNNQRKVIALTTSKLEIESILNYTGLTESELEYSIKILEKIGI